MSKYLGIIMEGTFASIVLFAILSHAGKFTQMLDASSGALVGSVQALWGPGGVKK